MTATVSRPHYLDGDGTCAVDAPAFNRFFNLAISLQNMHARSSYRNWGKTTGK
jgi:hypothetical protein